MTVKKLIEILQTFDESRKVLLSAEFDTGNCRTLDGIYSIAWEDNTCDGMYEEACLYDNDPIILMSREEE